MALAKIPDNLKSYIREVEAKSGIPVAEKQLKLLADDLRETRYPRFAKDDPAYQLHKNEYKKRGVLENLKAEWSRETGQEWPKYLKIDDLGNPTINTSTGLPEMVDYQLHHINPQQFGGKHVWWNSHPVHPNHHQGGLHGRGSQLNQIVKEFKNNG